MGRPKINEDQRVRAYQMHVQGFGPSHIRKVLVEEFQDSEEAASLRTVKYWVKQFKSLKEEISRLDSPFQWHKLGQYGLPWEAGPFLMEMLRLIQSYNMKVHVVNAQLPSDSTSKTPSIPDATVREALWWWRVHQAAPEIGAAIGQLDDVHVIAGQFAIRQGKWKLILRSIQN